MKLSPNPFLILIGLASATVAPSDRVPTAEEINNHIQSNCTLCLKHDEAKVSRAEQVYGLLNRLADAAGTHDNRSESLMRNVGPIESILKRFDTKSRLRDDRSAETERIFSFARPAPEGFEFDNDLRTAYFDLGSENKKLVVREAKLFIFLKKPSGPSIELDVEVFKRTEEGGLATRPTYRKYVTLHHSAWCEFIATTLVRHWFEAPSQNYGIFVLATYQGKSVTIHPQDNDNNHNMYLEIEVSEEVREGRPRRDLDDCSIEQPIEECCRYPLTIDFAQFGWSWVVHPPRANVYYCSGTCAHGYLKDSVHSHFRQQSQLTGILPKVASEPCCHPTEFAPLTIIRKTHRGDVELTRIQNVIAVRCGCS